MQDGANNRSTTYFIARALQRCECCRKQTPVVALLLPPGHETFETEAESGSEESAPGVWQGVEAEAILFDVEHIPDSVYRHLSELSPHYRRIVDELTGYSHWANHCSFCNVQQADFDLYCEPEGAFMPISAEAAGKITLHQVNEACEAQASGYGYAPEFLRYTTRVKAED